MTKGAIPRLSKSLNFLVLLLFFFHFTILDVIAVPVPRTDEEKIMEIESRLSQEKKKLNAFNTQEKNVLFQLADLEQEVAEKRLIVNSLGKTTHLAKVEVKKLKIRLGDFEKALRNAEDRLGKRLVALYKHARKGYTTILAKASDLDDFWQRVKYIRSIINEDREGLTRLSEKKLRHKKEISLVQEQIVQIEAVKDKEKIRLSSLKKDLEGKVIRLMRIHKEKRFYEKGVRELQIAAKNLKKTLLEIEKQKRYKMTLPSRFIASKGRLPLPLDGKVIKGDKFLEYKGLNLHKGVFVEGLSNANVKAVFPGRVDFSGRLKGYGEIIIINHGSRYFTISAHLSQRIKEKGDAVEVGDVIGRVGRDRPSKRVRLYFEIRRAGKNLDPLKWLKVK